MTINKVLQLIRAHPIIVAVIAVAIPATVVAIYLNQPPKKPVYQWQINSERLRKQIDQFSDLAQPSKKP
jgi:hypothetical protein